jgi:hypothetical protein
MVAHMSLKGFFGHVRVANHVVGLAQQLVFGVATDSNEVLVAVGDAALADQ